MKCHNCVSLTCSEEVSCETSYTLSVNIARQKERQKINRLPLTDYNGKTAASQVLDARRSARQSLVGAKGRSHRSQTYFEYASGGSKANLTHVVGFEALIAQVKYGGFTKADNWARLNNPAKKWWEIHTVN